MTNQYSDEWLDAMLADEEPPPHIKKELDRRIALERKRSIEKYKNGSPGHEGSFHPRIIKSPVWLKK